MMNAATVIQNGVDKNPDKVAIIFEDRRITYEELDKRINRVANGLLGLGLTHGDVVSLFLPSLPELIISYLGIVKAGMAVNVVNAMLKDIEVEYILKDCQPKAVLLDSRRSGIIDRVKDKVDSLKLQILVGEEKKENYLAYEDLVSQASDRFSPYDCDEEDLCHLMYTSGTTGWPKGVMATHRNIYHNATEFGKAHFEEKDTLMVGTPIFHCWGLVNGTFGMLSRNGTVITVERFYPERALADVEKFHPTAFIGVPPMYNLLVKSRELPERDISSVNYCLSAATKMPVELIKMVEEKLKWRYAEAWGLTEVSCVATTAPVQKTKIGSCGYGMADTKIKVVDEKGQEVPRGEQGELLVKGTCVTKGYLNKPEATREVFDQDGWFHSGDIAIMDEDGYAFIVDRSKDMINVGGEKVFPSEVEDIMLTNPKIKDLALVGMADELKGEAVKAFIVLKDGESGTAEEIQEFCKERMAPYKVPTVVEFVEEIPRSASGKALRRLLRERESDQGS
jgi:long-chain acyl-CoA synthetase